MKQISSDELQLLIDKGIIKCVAGKYIGLITGSPYKHGKSKARFVEDKYYNELLKLKNK